jgi:hypothetical protein
MPLLWPVALCANNLATTRQDRHGVRPSRRLRASTPLHFPMGLRPHKPATRSPLPVPYKFSSGYQCMFLLVNDFLVMLEPG